MHFKTEVWSSRWEKEKNGPGSGDDDDDGGEDDYGRKEKWQGIQTKEEETNCICLQMMYLSMKKTLKDAPLHEVPGNNKGL